MSFITEIIGLFFTEIIAFFYRNHWPFYGDVFYVSNKVQTALNSLNV